MNEIDEIFGTFDEKKRKEQGEIDEHNKAAEMQQRNARRVLDEIVMPVVYEWAAMIKQKGHRAECKRVIDYIELSFTPSSTYHASLLKFIHDGSGAIVIDQVVNKKDGLDLGTPDQFPSVVPNEATQEWIQARVLDFIRRVLETN